MIHYPKHLQTALLSYPVDVENQMSGFMYDKPEKLQKAFQEFQNYFQRGIVIMILKKIKESYLRFIWSVMNMAKELDFSQYSGLEQQPLWKGS